MELLMGFEPMTSSLPMKCSTTELQQLAVLAKPKRACGEGARQITGTFLGGGAGRLDQATRPVAVRGRGNGAGGGNRTLVYSLESCRSTIELHPPLFGSRASDAYGAHEARCGGNWNLEPDCGGRFALARGRGASPREWWGEQDSNL